MALAVRANEAGQVAARLGRLIQHGRCRCEHNKTHRPFDERRVLDRGATFDLRAMRSASRPVSAQKAHALESKGLNFSTHRARDRTLTRAVHDGARRRILWCWVQPLNFVRSESASFARINIHMLL